METYLVHPDKLQEKVFLEALEVPYEIKKDNPLPDHVIRGIQKGQEDIKAGRTITLAEFEKRIVLDPMV